MMGFWDADRTANTNQNDTIRYDTRSSEVAVNSLGNRCSQSWRRKRKAAMGRICKKREVFESGMKERVGDGKLIIISMTVSSINERIRCRPSMVRVSGSRH